MRKFDSTNEFRAHYKQGYEILNKNLSILIMVISKIIECDDSFNNIIKKHKFYNINIDTIEKVLSYIQRKEVLSEEKSDYIRVLGNLYIFKNICKCILVHKYIPEDVIKNYCLKPNIILPIFSALSGEPSLKILYEDNNGKL